MTKVFSNKEGVRMQRNHFKTILAIVGFTVISALLPVAEVLADTCTVTKHDGNEGAGEAGSLARAIFDHGQETTQQLCSDKIVIGANILVTETLVLDETEMANHTKLEITGAKNSEGKPKWNIESQLNENSGEPVFLVKAKNVTISNLNIVNEYKYTDEGDENDDEDDVTYDARNDDGTLDRPTAPFVKCEGVENLKLDNIVIKNNPSAALEFVGCDNLTINSLTIDAQDEYYYSDFDIDTPYINITGSSNVTIGQITIEASPRPLDRKVLSITAGEDGAPSSNLSLQNFTVESGAVLNPEITVLYLENIDNLLEFNVDIKGVVAKNGVVLKDVTSDADISHTIHNITAKNSDDPGDASPGDALQVLDSSNLTFKLEGDISYFGGSGVVFEGGTDLAFSGGEIKYNGRYGVVTDPQAHVTLKSFLTKQNGDCGVYLQSKQVVQDVQYVNNHNSCSLGVSRSSNLEVDSNTVMLVATAENKVALDVNKNLVPGTTELELHYFYAIKGSTFDASMTAKAQGATFPLSTGPTRLSTIQRPTINTGGADLFGDHVDPVKASSDETKSKTEGNNFPDNDIPVDSSSYTFMVILQNESNQVTGVWYGNTSSTADSSCIYEFLPEDGGGCACLAGPSSSEKIRVYRAGIDTDGDDILDEDEHGGDCPSTEYDTVSDREKTFPYLADTDGDGLDDLEEREGYIDENGTVDTQPDPLDWDTDSDNISDGDEDWNGNGIYDLGLEPSALSPDTDGDGVWDNDEIGNNGVYDEGFDTNPLSSDTDGDGMKDPHPDDTDPEDKHPLCNDLTSNCTYSDCVNKEDIGAVDPSYSDVAPDYTADDDGDGIPNRTEDKDFDCTFDYADGETNPLAADTDSDLCSDGEEDIDRNGTPYDAEGILVETDPLNDDTDGDQIRDGVEVAGCNYTGALSDTNPLSDDTDGDLLSDSQEDINFDGDLDVAETDPALADSDNDGLRDAAWPVAVVRGDDGLWGPADPNEDLSPFVRDPSNQTLNYYCGISDKAGEDTDGDTIPDAIETPTCKLQPNKSDTADPNAYDTDEDGANDALEINCLGTNPHVVDTDADGPSDWDEVSNNDQISEETVRGYCDENGVAYNLGATNPLNVNTSCSLNGNLLATSAGVAPITVLGVALLLLALLRRLQVRTKL